MAATIIDTPKTQVSKTPKGLSPRKQKTLLRWIASGKPANKWLEKHKLHTDRLYEQLHADRLFQVAYARAREMQAGSYVDHMINISDNEDGCPQRDRLRIDSRKWAPSKIDSSKWGDKLAIETTTKVSIIDHLQEVINVTPTLEEAG